MLNFVRLTCSALTAFAVSCLAVCAPAAALGPIENLQLSLMTLSTQAPGQVAIAVEDIPTGQRMNVNGSANMPAASVIKIPVMVEVFRQMSLGTMTLNDHITLKAHDRDWGWGDLADARVGGSYTVNTLLRLMITRSDNTATNMLIRRVTRAKINATMQRLHLHTTVLGEDIRSDGNIRSLRTSPNDMVTLLDKMVHESLIDSWSSRQMLLILAGQEHNGLLPVPLPRGIEIAHKTGTLHDTLNDVGVVFLNGDPYVIAVMTTNLPTLDVGRSFIRNVSRVAYNAFAHRQLSSMALAYNAPASPSQTHNRALQADGLALGSQPIVMHGQSGEMDISTQNDDDISADSTPVRHAARPTRSTSPVITRVAQEPSGEIPVSDDATATQSQATYDGHSWTSAPQSGDLDNTP